jgi:phosphoribosylanthranilate isomerase
MKIKICGIKDPANALAVARNGADLIGLNLYPPSPRALTPPAAAALAAHLRAALGADCPLLVGVFVNETADSIVAQVQQIGLDAAQLSGDEPPDTLADLAARGIAAYKALRPTDADAAIALWQQVQQYAPQDPRLPQALVDAYHPKLYGGTGEQVSAQIAAALAARVPRLLMAGGLTPTNVGGLVAAARPWGIDVASGVEAGTAGYKDLAKVRALVAHANAASSGVSLRALTAADWPEVAAIYQHGIDSGNATFETQLPTWERWDAGHRADCRLVAVDADGALVGWAALSPVSARAAYAGVAEISIYIAGAAQGRGVGRALLWALIAEAERAGVWMLQAVIHQDNAASIALHQRCGLRMVGYRERIAQHHGVWKNTVLLERRAD